MSCMHSTSTFSRNSSEPDISVLNELKAEYKYLESLPQRRFQRLCIIKLSENDSAYSSTKYIRDNLLQSNLTWQDFVIATQLNKIKKFDLNAFNKFKTYHTLSSLVTWRSFKTYFDLNSSKFTIDINAILEKELAIFKYLCAMKTNKNMCFIMESRHTGMTKSQTNKASKLVIDEKEHELQQTIYKEDEVQLLVTGYMNAYEYVIPKDIINACIEYTYGRCYTVDRLLRNNITKTHNGYYNINWNKSVAEMKEVEDRKVPKHAIKNRWSLFPQIHSLHSKHNLPNTMTWLYIKSEDIVEINMYITDVYEQSYGTRITADNVERVVSSLFVDDIKASLDGFKSATDPTLEQNRMMLYKNPQIDATDFNQLNEDITSNWYGKEQLMEDKLSQQTIPYEYCEGDSIDTIIIFEHVAEE